MSSTSPTAPQSPGWTCLKSGRRRSCSGTASSTPRPPTATARPTPATTSQYSPGAQAHSCFSLRMSRKVKNKLSRTEILLFSPIVIWETLMNEINIFYLLQAFICNVMSYSACVGDYVDSSSSNSMCQASEWRKGNKKIFFFHFRKHFLSIQQERWPLGRRRDRTGTTVLAMIRISLASPWSWPCPPPGCLAANE